MQYFIHKQYVMIVLFQCSAECLDIKGASELEFKRGGGGGSWLLWELTVTDMVARGMLER